MAEFDFASQPPRRDEDDGIAFAPSTPQKNDRDSKSQTGMEALKNDRKLRSEGGDPNQGLMALATLLGMARHIMPHVDAVDGPSGLMSLLRSPISGKPPTSDGQRYSLELNQNATLGGGIAGTNTAVGTPGGVQQDGAKTAATNQAMQSIGNLAGAMGSGLAGTLAEASGEVQNNLAWLDPNVKELYKIKRK
jgi:hypothetical protein